MCLCDTVLRVSHSYLTKQTLLAQIVTQHVEKQQVCSFLAHLVNVQYKSVPKRDMHIKNKYLATVCSESKSQRHMRLVICCARQ